MLKGNICDTKSSIRDVIAAYLPDPQEENIVKLPFLDVSDTGICSVEKRCR